ncbi:MAG: hypothetical protein PHN88_15050 [Ignavibacteria bacterium]|nr:hypothetical protein [Ignavibacteria bacterium]
MKNELEEFQNSKYLELEEILKSKSAMPNENLESFMYALLHISSSISKIYFEIIPSILVDKNIKDEVLNELLVKLRNEFRHIQYHIEDGKLSKY